MRAESARPRRSDLACPGVDFLERVGADLLVVHGPVAARCPADGPASRSVQGQGRGPRWPLAVQDVPVWMIGEPGDVALVVFMNSTITLTIVTLVAAEPREAGSKLIVRRLEPERGDHAHRLSRTRPGQALISRRSRGRRARSLRPLPHIEDNEAVHLEDVLLACCIGHAGDW